jgi:hypothetical protein
LIHRTTRYHRQPTCDQRRGQYYFGFDKIHFIYS